MSEKETVDAFRANSSLRQANYNPPATVKQQPLAGPFDKNGRAESFSIREGSSRTE
jgi:hypothetical protein